MRLKPLFSAAKGIRVNFYLLTRTPNAESAQCERLRIASNAKTVWQTLEWRQTRVLGTFGVYELREHNLVQGGTARNIVLLKHVRKSWPLALCQANLYTSLSILVSAHAHFSLTLILKAQCMALKRDTILFIKIANTDKHDQVTNKLSFYISVCNYIKRSYIHFVPRSIR